MLILAFYQLSCTSFLFLDKKPPLRDVEAPDDNQTEAPAFLLALTVAPVTPRSLLMRPPWTPPSFNLNRLQFAIKTIFSSIRCDRRDVGVDSLKVTLKTVDENWKNILKRALSLKSFLKMYATFEKKRQENV
ncbi:hypothetical protein L596_030791 [Steinernema carpocapsae]|uniref:Uncharacterized protein n=1 Tax=Steinernema carpocapsae TaxID=34508 RepID=A0A4U5LNS1_STECR|nr:hypothetical protein L596_030791 [Steinernema carpocapsae]